MEIYFEVPKVNTQQGMGSQRGLVFKTQVAYQSRSKNKDLETKDRLLVLAPRVGHHGDTGNCQLQKITERHTSKGNAGDLRST